MMSSVAAVSCRRHESFRKTRDERFTVNGSASNAGGYRDSEKHELVSSVTMFNDPIGIARVFRTRRSRWSEIDNRN